MSLLKKFTLNISAIAVIVMALMEIMEIFARSIFNHSFLIVDEFAGYLLACIVFTGLINSYNTGTFVRVELVYSLMKGKAKHIIDLIFAAIQLAFIGTVGYHILKLNIKSFQFGLVSAGYLKTPIGYPQLFMSLGIVCFFVYLILDVINKIRGGHEE